MAQTKKRDRNLASKFRSPGPPKRAHSDRKGGQKGRHSEFWEATVAQGELATLYSCNFPQYLCLSDILFECNPNIHGQRMMLVLPNQRLSWVFFHVGLIFCLLSSQFYVVHIHRQEYFPRFTNERSQFGHVSQPFSNRTFSICLFPS